MRGRVAPGVRCLIVGPVTTVNYWLGVEVIVIRESNDERLKAYAAFYPGQRWWHCRAADGQTRVCQDSEGGNTLDNEGFTAERFLMPLDPDADLKSEPDLYSIPVSKPGTGKVPDLINARSI